MFLAPAGRCVRELCFVEDDDGESDFDSPIGFDDRAELVEAVARI